MNPVTSVTPDADQENDNPDHNNGWHAEHDAILGMTPAEAVALWKSKGAPPIHVAPGVDVYDLPTLFEAWEPAAHVKAVGRWLQEAANGQTVTASTTVLLRKR